MTSSLSVVQLDFFRGVRDVLTRARALISDEDHWVQGTATRQFTALEPSLEERVTVTAYCASGAIVLLPTASSWHPVVWAEARALAIFELAHEVDPAVLVPRVPWKLSEWSSTDYSYARAIVQRWNDDPAREHDDVLALFDRAIARVNSDLDQLEHVTRSQR